MSKICTKCGIEKSLEEFHKSSASKDGHKPICVECRSRCTTHPFTPKGMKWCGGCKQNLPRDKFDKNGNCLRSLCKECRSDYRKGTPMSDNAKKNARTKYEENMTVYYDYLSTQKCADCGDTDIRVLEFDHLPEYEKSFNIAHRAGYFSWDKTSEEIKKCEVVCRNCHAKRTIDRRENAFITKYIKAQNSEV